jgi:hypothetical protein
VATLEQTVSRRKPETTIMANAVGR